MTKTYFDKKIKNFNRKITSNKTQYLELQKKLYSLITKDYNFFSGRIYFTSNDGSQNTFVNQPILDTLELKKGKGTDYVLNWKSNGVYNSYKLCHYILLSYIPYIFLDIKWETN